MTRRDEAVSASQQSPQSTVEQFVRDAAARGCRIIFQNGGTCLDRMRSARAARDHGIQPERGPRWGSEGDLAAFRDRMAEGHSMCRGCRATLLLEGEYVPPSEGMRDAA